MVPEIAKGTAGKNMTIHSTPELMRLYRDARQNELRLQNDLKTAREVQQLLLPRRAPDVRGLDLAVAYSPALELGGDFYDFLPQGRKRLALALGDVCGKGTAAALLGALTIGILRAHPLGQASQPGDVLASLNDRIYAARLDTRFVAMLYATYDADTRRLVISNAGNPYPLVFRNRKIDKLRVSGVPLGLLSGSQYETVSIDVQPGDVVVFASDGIVESHNGEQKRPAWTAWPRLLVPCLPTLRPKKFLPRFSVPRRNSSATIAHSKTTVPFWSSA
jgi:serine phosphatase RsbU (regulator of sigma subunit)